MKRCDFWLEFHFLRLTLRNEKRDTLSVNMNIVGKCRCLSGTQFGRSQTRFDVFYAGIWSTHSIMMCACDLLDWFWFCLYVCVCVCVWMCACVHMTDLMAKYFICTFWRWLKPGARFELWFFAKRQRWQPTTTNQNSSTAHMKEYSRRCWLLFCFVIFFLLSFIFLNCFENRLAVNVGSQFLRVFLLDKSL